MSVIGKSPGARRRRAPYSLCIGLVGLLTLALLAILGPAVWGTKADSLTPALRAGASGAHWLGTDALGRDVVYRTLVAARLTLVMAGAATIIAVVGGVMLGTTILLWGRRVRSVGEGMIGLMVAYPPIIVALAITAIFRPSVNSVVIAIGIAFIPQFARLSNTMSASVVGKDFVVVAQLVGLKPMQVFRRHVMPNVVGPMLVLTSVMFGTAIITLSGLSFIGLGVQEPAYDWGRLLSSGLQDLSVNRIEVVGPGAAILLAGLALGLVGDGLDQYLDPRRSVRRAPKVSRREGTKGVAVAASESGIEASEGISEEPLARTRLSNDYEHGYLVSVDQLYISAGSSPTDGPLVRGVSLDVKKGEMVAIVGESGSGKTLTAMAIARLLPPGLKWSSKTMCIDGHDISDPARRTPRELATSMGIVFQDPSSCFNPAMHIGRQITEVARVHQGLSKRAANEAGVARLRETQVSAPELRMRQFPHQLSGGMRQRAMIAMALMTAPALLIADEPTTALDVTVQAEVLRLLTRVSAMRDMAVVFISHDIKVVTTLAHRVCVMYAGRIVEQISAADLREGRVSHPYTRALLAAAPKLTSTAREERLTPLPGRPPQPGIPIEGCAFASRCPLVEEKCLTVDPVLEEKDGGGVAACHVSTGPLGMVGSVVD